MFGEHFLDMAKYSTEFESFEQAYMYILLVENIATLLEETNSSLEAETMKENLMDIRKVTIKGITRSFAESKLRKKTVVKKATNFEEPSTSNSKQVHPKKIFDRTKIVIRPKDLSEEDEEMVPVEIRPAPKEGILKRREPSVKEVPERRSIDEDSIYSDVPDFVPEDKPTSSSSSKTKIIQSKVMVHEPYRHSSDSESSDFKRSKGSNRPNEKKVSKVRSHFTLDYSSDYPSSTDRQNSNLSSLSASDSSYKNSLSKAPPPVPLVHHSNRRIPSLTPSSILDNLDRVLDDYSSHSEFSSIQGSEKTESRKPRFVTIYKEDSLPLPIFKRHL